MDVLDSFRESFAVLVARSFVDGWSGKATAFAGLRTRWSGRATAYAGFRNVGTIRFLMPHDHVRSTSSAGPTRFGVVCGSRSSVIRRRMEW